MKLNMSKLLNFLLSIKSIILINLLIILKKKFNQDLKIVFFYFPVKSYQNNFLELIDEIRKENNLDVISICIHKKPFEGLFYYSFPF